MTIIVGSSRLGPRHPLDLMNNFDFDDAHCYATHRNCVIQIWRGEITEPHIALMEERWNKLVRAQGSLCILSVVTASAAPPSPARRHDIKDLYVRLDSKLQAIATVFEDQGMKGSTASIVMSTVLLLVKPHYPTKNTTSMLQACEWLSETVPMLDADPLLGAVTDATKKYTSVCKQQFGQGLVRTREEIRAAKTR